MFLNVVFMVIVAPVLASIFVIYMDLKDSVLAAYSTISLASLCNWLVKKKPLRRSRSVYDEAFYCLSLPK